jgi:hypothetical protein
MESRKRLISTALIMPQLLCLHLVSGFVSLLGQGLTLETAQSGEMLPNMHNELVSPMPLGSIDAHNVPGEYSMNERGDVSYIKAPVDCPLTDFDRSSLPRSYRPQSPRRAVL